MKNILTAMLCLVLLVGTTGALSGCDFGKKKPPAGGWSRVTLITTPEKEEDPVVNEMAARALIQAQADFGLVLELWQPKTEKGIFDSAIQAVKNGSCLIVLPGQTDAQAVQKLAEKYPAARFAVVNSARDLGKNVMSLSLEEQEGAFLAGVIAARTTNTQTVGFVGGRDDARTRRSEYGFRAGVAAVRSEATVLVDYTEVLGDPETGRLAALTQIDRRADVIFQHAGKSGLGVITAAGERDVWAIGSNTDQSAIDPRHVLCSVFQKVDDAVYFAVQSVMDGSFAGGVQQFGIDFMAVGYSDAAGNVPTETAAVASAFAAAIASGEVEVPRNRTAYEAFHVPEGGWPFLASPKPEEIAQMSENSAPGGAPAMPGSDPGSGKSPMQRTGDAI